MRIAVTAVAIASYLCGCSMSSDWKLAEQAVPEFHDRLDAGQFDMIYDASGEELKRAATREAFHDLLAAVHRKLGDTKSSTREGWNINYTTAGTHVTLSYSTAYAEGNAAEQFVYLLEGGKALLVGYHINSNELVLK